MNDEKRFFYSCIKENLDKLKEIINKIGNVENLKIDHVGRPTLLLACQNLHGDVFKYLIENMKYDINAYNNFNSVSPLLMIILLKMILF